MTSVSAWTQRSVERLGLLTVVILGAGLCAVGLALPIQASHDQANRPVNWNTSRVHDALYSSDAITYYAYLPIAKSEGCLPTGDSYGSLSVNDWQPAEYAAESHPDLNLALRGYTLTNAYLGLVEIGGTDPKAPQLATLFAIPRRPPFTAVHRVYDWLWGCCRGDPIEDPEVTLVDLATTPGETIHVPESGYEIGEGHEQVLVLYASSERLTIKYTREDTIVGGYGLHLENICVDPNLLALYQALNSAGRYELPALRAGQALGHARGSHIGVVVRDTGFLDPRWHYDWWCDYSADHNEHRTWQRQT